MSGFIWQENENSDLKIGKNLSYISFPKKSQKKDREDSNNSFSDFFSDEQCVKPFVPKSRLLRNEPIHSISYSDSESDENSNDSERNIEIKHGYLSFDIKPKTQNSIKINISENKKKSRFCNQQIHLPKKQAGYDSIPKNNIQYYQNEKKLSNENQNSFLENQNALRYNSENMNKMFEKVEKSGNNTFFPSNSIFKESDINNKSNETQTKMILRNKLNKSQDNPLITMQKNKTRFKSKLQFVNDNNDNNYLNINMNRENNLNTNNDDNCFNSKNEKFFTFNNFNNINKENNSNFNDYCDNYMTFEPNNDSKSSTNNDIFYFSSDNEKKLIINDNKRDFKEITEIKQQTSDDSSDENDSLNQKHEKFELCSNEKENKSTVDIVIGNTSKWPLLLNNYEQLLFRDEELSPNYTLNRPLRELMKYGVIILDKPSNFSSYEIIELIQKHLKVKKVSHSGTLDPKMSGMLIICIESATRITKLLQKADKEYTAVIKFSESVDKSKLQKAIKFLTGKIYLSPPITSNSANMTNQLRVREIYENKLIEYDQKNKKAIIKIKCEAGTYISKLCENIGYILGIKSEVVELKRTKIGEISEDIGLVPFDELKKLFNKNWDESIIRKIIRPLEYLLTGYKRIIVKDRCVESVCNGMGVYHLDVLRFSNDINVDDLVVIVSTKGEAIALAIALMSSQELIATRYIGYVANIKRVIMNCGTYRKNWENGPVLFDTKRLINNGILGENWLKSYLDKKLNE